jgi:hypothetical protein
MLLRNLGLGAASLAMFVMPAAANASDYRYKYDKKLWELRAECNEDLDEAESRWEFRKITAKCDEKFRELERKMHYKAHKERRTAYKDWRKDRYRDRDDDWDD